MTSRGRGHRGRPRGTGQTPPVFDQQAFIVGRQEDPSNLQRFRAYHPPKFTRGGDPMVVDHWFIQIEKVSEAMEITSDATRIRLTALQLEGEAQV